MGLFVGLGLVVGSVVGAFSYYLFTGVVPWSVAATMFGCGLVFSVYGAIFPSNTQSALEDQQRRQEDTQVSLKILGATLVAFLAVVAIFAVTLAVA